MEEVLIEVVFVEKERILNKEKIVERRFLDRKMPNKEYLWDKKLVSNLTSLFFEKFQSKLRSNCQC